MKKILFVCHGNICRSPMAKFIFSDLVRRKGLAAEYFIDSAATSDEETGNPMYPPAREELMRRGVPFDSHRARRMNAEDYQNFDVIAVMDEQNLSNVRRMTGGDPKGKVHLLLEYAGEHAAISDPWFTRDFARAYDDILRGCEGLLATTERERAKQPQG